MKKWDSIICLVLMGCSPCKDGDSITNPQLIIISNTATINNSQKVPPEDKKKIDEKNENKLIDWGVDIFTSSLGVVEIQSF